MSDKFNDFFPNNKRSIRDIPIPTKEEKAILDAEAVREDKETASDNIQGPVKTIHHGEVVSMDGIKSPRKSVKRRVSKVETTSIEINRVNNEVQKPQFSVSPETVTIKDPESTPTEKKRYKIEPAFVDKNFLDQEEEYIPNHSKAREEYPAVSEEKESFQSGNSSSDSDSEETFTTWRKKHKRGYVFWALCIGAVVVIFVAVSSFFVSANVRITPKKYEVTLESAKLYISEIPHKTVDVDSEISIDVASKGTVKVDRKAKGTVVLYNAFSSADQKLTANTRLETSDGKIFRLDNPITIPGQKTTGGKKVPGSVEALVTADKSGDDYNVGFKDFKLAAYKGTDRYEKIYARSKTNIDNGYTGEVPNISQKEIASSTASLKTILSQKIEELILAKAEKYPDHVYVPGSHITNFNPISQKTSADGNQVTLKGTAKATAVFFEKKSLSRQILNEEKVINTASTTQSKITYTGDITKIKAAFPADSILADLASGKNTYLTVTGTSTMYSTIDESILSQAISRLNKVQAIPVVKELVDSDQIEISIWPWWIRTLPTKSAIKVDIL